MSNAEAIRKLQKTLTERFPVAFPKDQEAIRPLKLGIFEDLKTRLGESTNPKILQRALAYQTNRAHYWLAIVHGSGVRIDLDGNQSGTVDDKAKALATEKLAKLDQHYKDESQNRKRHLSAEKAAQAAKAQRHAEREKKQKEKERRRKEHEARVQKARARREQREKETQSPGEQQPVDKPKVEIRYSLTDKKKPDIKVKKRRKLLLKTRKK